MSFSSPAVCFYSRAVDSAPLFLPPLFSVAGILNIAIIRNLHHKRVEPVPPEGGKPYGSEVKHG